MLFQEKLIFSLRIYSFSFISMDKGRKKYDIMPMCPEHTARTLPSPAPTAAHHHLPLTTLVPTQLRTFAPEFAYLRHNLLSVGVYRNLLEPIRVYPNPSDFLRLVLIDSDKFRFLPPNISLNIYHHLPPPQHTITSVCAYLHRHRSTPSPTHNHTHAPTPAHSRPHLTKPTSPPQRTITCP